MRRIFSDDPHERVVIHVGYSQARKLEQDGVRWMAMRLQQKTGIVPLSVDQTTFGPIGNKEPVIFEARRADEPDDAVPVDRILVDPGEDLPLLLPVGTYRVRAKMMNSPWSAPVTVRVR